LWQVNGKAWRTEPKRLLVDPFIILFSQCADEKQNYESFKVWWNFMKVTVIYFSSYTSTPVSSFH
jgi:hypothetical protein